MYLHTMACAHSAYYCIRYYVAQCHKLDSSEAAGLVRIRVSVKFTRVSVSVTVEVSFNTIDY